MKKTWRALLAIAPLVFGACHRSDPGDIDFGGPGGPGAFGDIDFGTTPFDGQQPVFGATVTQATPPPPISGGTLTVLHDGQTAVAADPDRDHIYVVDLQGKTKLADIALSAGDEPGRVIEDGAGRVHVALRGGGAFVTIDPATWTISSRRSVCAVPRGLAWEASTDLVHVACAGGELVSFPSASGDATRTLQLAQDLRDVIAMDGKLYVSQFRTAQLFVVDATGNVGTPMQPASSNDDIGEPVSPAAAWRLTAIPEAHTIYMLHQRGVDSTIDVTQPGGYGGGGDPCGGIVSSTITPIVDGTPTVAEPALMGATLSVDIAYSAQSDAFAVVAAGNAKVPNASTVILATRFTPTTGATNGQEPIAIGGCDGAGIVTAAPGLNEPIAVAFSGDNRVVVQSREPAELFFGDTGETISLSAVSKADTGHAAFHANAGGNIACASCHLEGGEDGRTWTFDTVGPRRTMAIRGGILGTEPFHWDGTEKNFSAIMTDVFVHRMSGPTLPADQQTAMQNWVDHIPLLVHSAPSDAAAVTRGQALFEDAENVGCISCHSGPKFTNNATVDVGTGGMFQVPALHGVAWRAPYLHDGSAATLEDRFTPVGGGDSHGHTSQLTQAQISDLIAYLGTI